LVLRADIQRKITRIKGRLLDNTKVQEGEAPSENPQDLLAELVVKSAKLSPPMTAASI
jgi:hypothetical protein